MTGGEIHPHRRDLRKHPFWRCPTCQGYVGCHHKTEDRTRPLGVIPSPAIRNGRRHIHSVLDPLWKHDLIILRSDLYDRMARALGIEEYHTAELRTVEECRAAYRAAMTIKKELEAA